MTAIPDSDATEPFGRYRFRGLDPKSVERWAINYENENAALRGQIAALEARAAKADTFAEDAVREMVSLQEIVQQAETERAILEARQRLFREEAAQVVHDAWAEANVVRTQTQQLVERTQAQLAAAKQTHAQQLDTMSARKMAETEATIDEALAALAAESEEHRARIASEMAAHQTRLASERAQHESRIAAELAAHQSRLAALEEQRARIVMEIEACTARVLNAIAPLKGVTLPASSPFAAGGYADRDDSGRPLEDDGSEPDDATEPQTMFVTQMHQPTAMAAIEAEEIAPNGIYPASLEDAEVIC